MTEKQIQEKVIQAARSELLKDAKKAIAAVFVDELNPNKKREFANTNDVGNFITQLEIEIQQQLKKVENWNHLPRFDEPKHDHYLIKNEQVFEVYKSASELKSRFLIDVSGLADNELLTDTDIDFVEIKYLNK